MPLQVARLRDSDLAAEEEPEACWYAVLLWATSWHQLPAGSLPDNDTVLMRLVGLGRDKKTWAKFKTGAMRGFILCSDGRFYHPVVAEQVNEAWDGKVRQRHRTFCAAVRKHNERNPKNKVESPSFEEWDALGRPEKVADAVTDLSRVTDGNVTRDNDECHGDVARETPSKRKGQGQGQGQGQGDSNKHISGTDVPSSSGDADDTSDDHEFELAMEDDPPPPTLKPEHVVEAWNSMAERNGLPLVKVVSDERRKKLRTMIRAYDIGQIRQAIGAIERSDFLKNGNGSWRGASFDFLLQKSSFIKLLEGQYDGR